METDDPSDANAGRRGPAERLLRLGESLLALFVSASRTRLELLAVEVAAERQRLFTMLALGLAFGLAVLLGLAFVSFLIIAYFWDTYRLVAIAAVSLFYALVAVVAALRLRRLFAEAPTPFAHTRDTLERDMAALRSRLHRAPSDTQLSDEPFSGDI